MKNLLVFLAGAVVGSAVTYMLLRDECEEIELSGELKKNETSGLEEAIDVENHIVTDSTDKPSIEEYAEQIGKLNYSQFSKRDTDKAATKKESSSEISVISPDEYGELDDYDQETLYFYEGDETLIDIYDEILQDEVNIVGTDYMNHFGDYDDNNTVFVRNDHLKTDYEIMLLHSSFTNSDSDSVDDE